MNTCMNYIQIRQNMDEHKFCQNFFIPSFHKARSAKAFKGVFLNSNFSLLMNLAVSWRSHHTFYILEYAKNFFFSSLEVFFKSFI